MPHCQSLAIQSHLQHAWMDVFYSTITTKRKAAGISFDF